MKLKDNVRARMRRYGLIVLLFIIISFIFWLESKSVFVVILFDILVFIILRFVWGRYINRRYNSSNLNQPRTVELTSTGILTYVDDVKVAVEWNKIDRVDETKEFTIFETKSERSIFIPNSAFKSREERAQFVDAAKQNMPSI